MTSLTTPPFCIRPVVSEAHERQFIQLPKVIYAKDPNWICPLDKDIRFVFDPVQNNFHRHGTIRRWLAISTTGETIGRVAAFVDYRTSHTTGLPTGGMGFFECIDDQKVAFALFDVCKTWLRQIGMLAMDGPINFGENNAWWGLVVEGFDPPIYRNNYNPPYYQSFFEKYGFQSYFDQHYFAFDIAHGLEPRYLAFGKRLASDSQYICKSLKLNKLNQFAEDFCEVYNAAWQVHSGYREMTHERVLLLFRQMKPVIDEDLIWFLYHQGAPVGFVVMLPELNAIIRNFRAGHFGIIEKLLLKAGLIFHHGRVAHGSVIGFKPAYQHKGLETLLLYHIHERLVPSRKYDQLRIGWVGDFHPKVLNLYKKLGFAKCQTARTYRKIFDPDIPFQKAPMIL